MVSKNTKSNLLSQDKDFGSKDTSYSSFWMFNKQRDIKSLHLKDSFVNFYDEKELLSEFNPTIAKNIISFWSESKDLVLDPFAGRTRAIVSYAMDRKYVGYEISNDVIKHMKERFKELKIKTDSIKLIHDDCYNMDIKEKVDLIFTCPPYHNLEKYESCKGQLSDIKTYPKFLNELILRLNKASSKLKVGKYMCIVIGDYRKNGNYLTIHSDLIQKMNTSSHLKLHDVIVMQNIPFNTAAFYFGARKKSKCTAKAHEYLLVWKKTKEDVDRTINCAVCGNETIKRSGVQKYCSSCKQIIDHKQRLEAKRRYDARKRM